MNVRRFQTLPPAQQAMLNRQFAWLSSVEEAQPWPSGVWGLAISVFDHWLTEAEAREWLTLVPAAEQARRNALHARFCQHLLAQTEVLGYVWRGRRKCRRVFRRWRTEPAGWLGERRLFRGVLPNWQVAFFEGWDDTHTLYGTTAEGRGHICACAAQAGLFVLPLG